VRDGGVSWVVKGTASGRIFFVVNFLLFWVLFLQSISYFPFLLLSLPFLARPPPYAPLGAAQFVPEDNFEVLRMGGLLSLVKSDSNVNISFVDFESKFLDPSFSHG